MSSAFQFFAPLAFFEKASAPEGKRKRIAGVISTEDLDKQGEVIIQKGLDLAPFLKEGWFNDNHSKKTADVLGYPEGVTQFAKGERLPDGNTAPTALTWAEGYLLDTPEASRIWDLGNALKKAGGSRRLGFSIEGAVQKRTGPAGRVVAKALVRNVAITNCFPGDVRVSGAAEKVTRRAYSGPMIELTLATGEKITGTPNHPVLTQRGWVALGELVEGQDRVGRFDRDLVPTPSIPHDVQDMPAPLQEVFDLALLSKATRWVGLAGEAEFHGDVSDSDVDVVLAEGLLKERLESSFFQKFGKEALPASDKELPSLASDGLRAQLLEGGFLAAPSDVRGVNQLLSLGGGAELVPTNLFLMPAADNAKTLGDVVHSPAVQAKAFSEEPRTLSSRVGFSHIASKRFVDGFVGHVFNLQTSHGWYDANGIVAHNCPVGEGTRLEVLAKSLGDVEKGLSMGEATPGSKPAGPKSGPGAGQVLAPQSLEQDGQQRLLDDGDDKEISKSAAVARIQHRFACSPQTAERLFQTIGILKDNDLL